MRKNKININYSGLIFSILFCCFFYQNYSQIREGHIVIGGTIEPPTKDIYFYVYGQAFIPGRGLYAVFSGPHSDSYKDKNGAHSKVLSNVEWEFEQYMINGYWGKSSAAPYYFSYHCFDFVSNSTQSHFESEEDAKKAMLEVIDDLEERGYKVCYNDINKMGVKYAHHFDPDINNRYKYDVFSYSPVVFTTYHCWGEKPEPDYTLKIEAFQRKQIDQLKTNSKFKPLFNIEFRENSFNPKSSSYSNKNENYTPPENRQPVNLNYFSLVESALYSMSDYFRGFWFIYEITQNSFSSKNYEIQIRTTREHSDWQDWERTTTFKSSSIINVKTILKKDDEGEYAEVWLISKNKDILVEESKSNSSQYFDKYPIGFSTVENSTNLTKYLLKYLKISNVGTNNSNQQSQNEVSEEENAYNIICNKISIALNELNADNKKYNISPPTYSITFPKSPNGVITILEHNEINGRSKNDIYKLNIYSADSIYCSGNKLKIRSLTNNLAFKTKDGELSYDQYISAIWIADHGETKIHELEVLFKELRKMSSGMEGSLDIE